MGAVAAAVVAEYATDRSFGLDQVWFTASVRTLEFSWYGRPSLPTALAVLLLAAAIALTRSDRRGAGVVWAIGVIGSAAISVASLVAYLFGAIALVDVTHAYGMAMSTAFAVLLLGRRHRCRARTGLLWPGSSLGPTGTHWRDCMASHWDS